MYTLFTIAFPGLRAVPGTLDLEVLREGERRKRKAWRSLNQIHWVVHLTAITSNGLHTGQSDHTQAFFFLSLSRAFLDIQIQTKLGVVEWMGMARVSFSGFILFALMDNPESLLEDWWDVLWEVYTQNLVVIATQIYLS